MINGTLIGNIGQDPELRTTRTGKKVAVFNVALNNRYTQRTTWYKIEAWNGLGEQVVMPYVKKGDQIAITIQDVRLETWKHRQSGDARGIIVVTADQIQLLSNRRDDDAAEMDSDYAPPPDDDENIPF